ncbi:MAG: response regulator transcription factor [Bacteriovorax sp.]|nr:response regulator transcription factor [Rhizobacter sp.]
MTPTALIAEDEPLLAANLQAELARLWPALRVVANVGHGAAAVEQALLLRPDVVFLDIRMPGMTGLEAAQALAEDWPTDTALPLIVFVTAYDQYALQAFERAAVDYVLKPVQPERLALTCARVQAALQQRCEPAAALPAALEATLAQLRSLLVAPGLSAAPIGAAANPSAASGQKLAVIQASVGAAIHMVPVAEVLYFEAADKYVRVITVEREYLIRTSLRELLPQLDEQRFWQVHRGTVVRAEAIATAVRDESGKVQLTLRGHKDKLVASRLYAHLFKAM